MASFHVYAGADSAVSPSEVRRIGPSDLLDALAHGLDDFMAKPSHLVFLGLIYPVVGVFLAAWTSGSGALPLLFPLMSGFALVGPVAALPLYEISRRRQLGMPTTWRHALEVRRSPAIPSIVAVGIWLFALFIAWLFAAEAIYAWQFGAAPPASLDAFVSEVLTTQRGWTMMLAGNAVGFGFAVIVLCTTVIAFPLLLDRDVGAYEAIHASLRVVAANPGAMALWGLIVAATLAIGSLPLFAGLAVVMPVLGHATWHLYRKVVA